MQVCMEKTVFKHLLHESFSYYSSYNIPVKSLLIQQIHMAAFYAFDVFKSQHTCACIVPVNFRNMDLTVLPEILCKIICIPAFLSIIYFCKNAVG
ncbi:hypothetical protein SDC9_158596 [bioreactor metagenome]|uniref:Uncharacterized protein n=1 Tax=bioreactor metagenome TaxID=1076179 RepID=A0A645FA88_9ZZZZ